MDLYMPICNGKESTKAIRQFLSDKPLEKPYICMLSSVSKAIAQKYDACDEIESYETKPIFKQGVQNLLIAAKVDYK